MLTLSALAVVEDRSLLIVDIRPLEERLGDLGFIPGSRSIPIASVGTASRTALLAENEQGRTVVFACVSGRRSERVLGELGAAMPFPLAHLDGGILAWSAEGLPLAFAASDAALEEDDPEIVDTADFQRALMACFVAEATELTLAGAELPCVNPRELLMRCFDVVGANWECPEVSQMYGVVDTAAALFRSEGADLNHIASNVSRMYALIGRLKDRTSQGPQ